MQKFFDNLEEYFQLKVIKPNELNNYITNNNLLDCLVNKIKPIIEKKNINLFIIPLPFSDLEVWWTDYAEIYLKKFYNYEFNQDKSYLSVIIKFNNDLTINLQENIEIEHDLTLIERQFVFDLFKNELPYNYEWSGRTSENMIIKYKNNINRINSLIIEESNIFPSLEVFIELDVIDIGKDHKINSFDDDPFEIDNEFSYIWDIILKNCDVKDQGYSYLNNKCLIDFKLHSIRITNLVDKILNLDILSLVNFNLKVNNISGSYKIDENEEYFLEEIKQQ